MVKRGPYTVLDKRYNVALNSCSEDDLRELAMDLGIGRHTNVNEMDIKSVISLIEAKGMHKITCKGEVNMGGGKGKQVKSADGNDVEILYHALMDWTFDELLDLYNDYKVLFQMFGDRDYKYKKKLVMEVIQTKFIFNQKEANIT